MIRACAPHSAATMRLPASLPILGAVCITRNVAENGHHCLCLLFLQASSLSPTRSEARSFHDVMFLNSAVEHLLQLHVPLRQLSQRDRIAHLHPSSSRNMQLLARWQACACSTAKAAPVALRQQLCQQHAGGFIGARWPDPRLDGGLRRDLARRHPRTRGMRSACARAAAPSLGRGTRNAAPRGRRARAREPGQAAEEVREQALTRATGSGGGCSAASAASAAASA